MAPLRDNVAYASAVARRADHPANARRHQQADQVQARIERVDRHAFDDRRDQATDDEDRAGRD
jgi:hypothetical protein